MSKFYDKGRGRKSAIEKKHFNQIQQIIKENEVDMSDYDVAKTPKELEELRDKLVDIYGSPVVEKRETSSSQVEPDDTDFDKTTEASKSNYNSDDVEETETFDEIEETSPNENSVNELTDDDYSLDDFKEVKKSHPFSEPFKEEDMFKATQYMNDDPDSPSEPVREVDPTENMERSSESTSTEDDSVENPWQKRTPNVSETLENNQDNSESRNDHVQDTSPLSEEEKKKVKLAKSTGKKASKMMAKQVTDLSCSLLEGGAKMYGKLPVSEKRIRKLEETGKLDRHYVFDKQTQKTFNHLVDEHKEFLDEALKIDPDQKEDLMNAILLVADKHEVEVTPESNLLMCVANIVITLGQASHQNKKKMDRMISKICDQYQLETQRMAEVRSENEELKEKIRTMEMDKTTGSFKSYEVKTDNVRSMDNVRKENDHPSDTSPVKKMSFGRNSENNERSITFAENEIESITSEIADQKRPTSTPLKKVDLKQVKKA